MLLKTKKHYLNFYEPVVDKGISFLLFKHFYKNNAYRKQLHSNSKYKLLFK